MQQLLACYCHLLEVMLSSVDNTEEKDEFSNSKGGNVSATIVYELYRQRLVEAVSVLPRLLIATERLWYSCVLGEGLTQTIMDPWWKVGHCVRNENLAPNM